MTRMCSFFSEVRRITARDYIPSIEDILRAPVRTDVGITETYIKMGGLSLRLCHISRQRSERKKWIHLFEGVTSIIFCAPLADYDQFGVRWSGMCIPSLHPDVHDHKLQNSLGESLLFFESVINSRWFLHTSIILFLTGIDEFKAKLPKVSCSFQPIPPVILFSIRLVRCLWTNTSQNTQVVRTSIRPLNTFSGDSCKPIAHA
jgi:guanine nucleotide-binding protein G(i) subunit alpha